RCHADRSRSRVDGANRSIPIRVAQFAVRRLETQRPRGANDRRRKNGLETVAAVYDRRTNYAALIERRYRRSTRISAADVALQVRDGCALAGDHVLDQIADRDHADDFATVDHGKVTNVFLSH